MAYQAIYVNQFHGGISDDPRKISAAEFQITKHFNIFKKSSTLVPNRSLEIDTNDGSTSTGMKQYFVRDFLYASASTKLYGLGQTASGNTKIVYKDDATTGNWTLPSSSEGNAAVKNGCFLEFKDNLWGFQGTNQLWKWGALSGTPSITNSAATVGATITSVAQGIVAPDGNAYLPYNNKLVRIAPGLTITDAAISVPDSLKITQLSNYGNYLLIGCSPVNSFNGVSKGFVWNMSSDLFTETIEFGEGDLRVLDVVEGQIVAIVDRYLNNSVGAGEGSLEIQVYGGGSPQTFKKIFTKALTGKTVPLSKTVKEKRLFFAAKIMTNTSGTEYHEGVWSFGRISAAYPFALTLDIVDENVNSSGIQSFGIAGNYFFIAHSNDGSIDKTDDASTYNFTSIYESQIFNFGDSSITKQLTKVSVTTNQIPTGGAVSLKYRVDGATSWSTIGTISTVGSLGRDFYNIESSGSNFSSFKEIELRIESTGGAEITGYKLEAGPFIGSN